MKFFVLIFLLLFSEVFSQNKPNLSQYKTSIQKIQAWDKYCKELIDLEKYELLLPMADQGIFLSQKQPKYLSQFYFLKGYAYEYADNQYKTATFYYEKSLQLAMQYKNQRQVVLSMMRLNYMYYSTKKFSKGKKLFDEIKKASDTIKDEKLKAILLGSLGEYYLDRSEFENFIKFKLKAIDLLLSTKNKTSLETNNIGVSYLQIADAYNDMESFEKALEYCKYSENYLNKGDGVAFMHNSYIEAYTNLGNISQALYHYQKIKELAKKVDFLDLNLSYANRNIAEYYLQTKNLDQAESYAENAMLFADKSNDEEIKMEAQIIKGKILFRKKDYKSAIKILNLALKYSFIYDKRAFCEINKELSQSYAAIQEWKKAYHYNNIYNKTNDSLLIESGKKSLADAEAKYQNKNKQKTINNLSAEKIIADLRFKDVQKQKLFLISGISLIAIIGGLLYYQSQNRKKNNEKLSLLNQELDKANKTKIQFFGILNHDLRSPVARLIHFINLQKESPEMMDDDSRLRLGNQTYHSAEQLLDQIDDLLLWSKGQMEHFLPEKKNVSVDYIFKDIKDNFNNDSIELLLQNSQNLSVFTDPEYLKTIIRNLTNNAVKVLENVQDAKIIWIAISTEKYVELSILDNGQGASLEKFRAFYEDNISIGIRTGLGMHLIRDLSRAINAKIIVDSKIKIGTIITIKIEKV